MQPARGHTEPLDRAGRDPRAEILRVNGERLQGPPEAIIVQQRRRDPQQLVHRRTRRPPSDVVERRRGAQAARDQRAHHLTDRQDRPHAARQCRVNGVLHGKLAQKVLDQQQRPDRPAGTRHRRVQPGERPRQRLQLPGVFQRILPTEVCHNTMTHLAVLIAVALDQLQIAVLAAGPLDLGLLYEHVATTLRVSSDGTTASIDPELPQHDPAATGRNDPQTRTPPHKPRGLPTLNRGKWG